MAKFIRVKCDDCGNEQNVFENPAGPVKCLACGKTLILPRSGRGKLKTQKLKQLE